MTLTHIIDGRTYTRQTKRNYSHVVVVRDERVRDFAAEFAYLAEQPERMIAAIEWAETTAARQREDLVLSWHGSFAAAMKAAEHASVTTSQRWRSNSGTRSSPTWMRSSSRGRAVGAGRYAASTFRPERSSHVASDLRPSPSPLGGRADRGEALVITVVHNGHGRDEQLVEECVKFAAGKLYLGTWVLPVKVTHGRYRGGNGQEWDNGCAYYYRPAWAKRFRTARHAVMCRVPSDDWYMWGRPDCCFHSKEAKNTYRSAENVPGLGNPAAEEAHARGLATLGQWPIYIVNDWKECLVRIAAHELMHIAQRLRGGSQSEIACERYTQHRLEEWRLKR